MLFKNKIAMITGAASGIGFAVASKLADEGAVVCLVDKNYEKTQQAADALQQKTEVLSFIGDITDPKFVEHCLASIEKQYGRLDVAFNNAGIAAPPQSIDEVDIDIWKNVIDINVNSVFYCLKYQTGLMKKAGSGAIVNNSSMLGLVGMENKVPYVASKHAVTGLTKAVALDCASHDIRVNSIHAGYIETPLIPEENRPALAQFHPLKRMGKPQEVAELVCFLLSDQAKFITGSQYVIDGGCTAR